MARSAKSDKPNILVIWGDDIGISNLSCYSHGLIQKPNSFTIDEAIKIMDASTTGG